MKPWSDLTQDEQNAFIHERLMGKSWDESRCRVCGFPLQGSLCSVDAGCSQRPPPAIRADAPPNYTADWSLLPALTEAAFARGWYVDLGTTPAHYRLDADQQVCWAASIRGLPHTLSRGDAPAALCMAVYKALARPDVKPYQLADGTMPIRMIGQYPLYRPKPAPFSFDEE